MRSLFWKIFLWFWLAMTLVIAATAFVSYTVRSTNENAPQNARTRRWRFVADTSFAQWAQAQAAAWERGTLLPKAPPEDIVSWLLDDGATLRSASQESAEWWILTPQGTLLAHEKAGASSPVKTLPNDVRRLARQAARTNRVVASSPEPLSPEAPGVAPSKTSTDAEPKASSFGASTSETAKNENRAANGANRDETIREELLASSAQTPRGRDVVFVARLTFPDAVRRPPRADATARRAFPLAFFFLRGEPLTRTSGVLTMLFTASLFCFWLARHVTRPVRQLRATVRELSRGNLAARSDRRVSQRSDELGDLGRDFDQMAAQLETLMTAQRRLISDVSHELRSPLARLNIALELARRESHTQLSNAQQSSTRLPDSPSLQVAEPIQNAQTTNAFNRIEREAARLEELVSQLLMLSRLESGATVENEETFDLIELVQQVAEDVRFEAQSQGRDIQFTQTLPAQNASRSTKKSKNGRVADALSAANGQNVDNQNMDGQNMDGQNKQLQLHGSRALLRSGLENVVRNAVRFTPTGTAVQIELQHDFAALNIASRNAQKTAPPIVLRVLDQGPGVPAEALPRLFQPFYRVEDARDRQSGGTGLGLAIAERAIHLHKGTIRAFNRENGGLCVEILLPQAESSAVDVESSTRLA